MTYFNTTNLKGEDLKNSTKRTETQEEKILTYFISNDNIFTPSEVWEAVFDSKTPLTSVRRGITNLTSDEKLLKTDQTKKEGIYGKPEYYWKLNN